MNYAKLENGYPVYSPKRMIIGEMWVYNPTTEQLSKMGYMPVIETAAPETDDKHYAVPSWEIVNDEIVESWSVLEIPDYATEKDYENALVEMGVQFDD